MRGSFPIDDCSFERRTSLSKKRGWNEPHKTPRHHLLLSSLKTASSFRLAKSRSMHAEPVFYKSTYDGVFHLDAILLLAHLNKMHILYIFLLSLTRHLRYFLPPILMPPSFHFWCSFNRNMLVGRWRSFLHAADSLARVHILQF